MNIAQHDLLKRLDESLLFQLSRAGQELFHSNMLYWLAKHRPHESAPVWDLLAPGLGLPSDAEREAKNIDLAIECVDGDLILENKVLALPDSKQLDRYYVRRETPANRNTRAKTKRRTEWRILSLIPIPPDEVPHPWQAVCYGDLRAPLRAVHLTGSEKGIVEAYVGLIDLLVDVADAFDPEREPEGSVFLNLIAMGRASAVIQKLRMQRCAAWIRHRLPASAPPVVPGFTRGQGLVEAFVKGQDGLEYGWQLQGDQFRLAIRTKANARAQQAEFEKHSRMLSELKGMSNHNYIDSSIPTDAVLYSKFLQKEDWNSFGRGRELNFIYKWGKLRRDIRWPDLVNLCVAQTERAMQFAADPASQTPRPFPST